MYLLSIIYLKNIFLKSEVQLSESLDIKCMINVLYQCFFNRYEVLKD